MFLPYFEFTEPLFKNKVLMNTHLEKLYEGGRWHEGPAWFGGGRYLIFSDIPNNRMMRFDETDNSVSVFRNPSNKSNGNCVDREGRLITCEHLGRRIIRTEHDGSITILADRYNGKKLNSPNDVIVDSKGDIWFTDPTYGIDGDYEGAKLPSEVGSANIYHLDHQTGAVTAVATDFVQPNGLAFSPDEKTLYIVDSGVTHQENGPKHIRKFDVDGISLKGGEVIAECRVGLYDGIRVDTAGDIWASTGEGVECISPEGKKLGLIKVPQVVANICFGGKDKNRLFICATTSLYAIYVNARSAI